MEWYLQIHVLLYLCLRGWVRVGGERRKADVGIYIMRLIAMEAMGSGRGRVAE